MKVVVFTAGGTINSFYDSKSSRIETGSID